MRCRLRQLQQLHLTQVDHSWTAFGHLEQMLLGLVVANVLQAANVLHVLLRPYFCRADCLEQMVKGLCGQFSWPSLAHSKDPLSMASKRFPSAMELEIATRQFLLLVLTDTSQSVTSSVFSLTIRSLHVQTRKPDEMTHAFGQIGERSVAT